MRIFLRSFFLVTVAVSLSIAPVFAQKSVPSGTTSPSVQKAASSGGPVSSSGLPGGATSLREAHGDWLVVCAVTNQGHQSGKACSLSQEQTDAKSRQRIIAVELQALPSANVALLFMPFGLNLSSGATLQIDEGPKGQALPFRTCLPAGCIVPANIDARTLASLRNAKTLRVYAKADNGRDAAFLISLNGFGRAFDRALALAKP